GRARLLGGAPPRRGCRGRAGRRLPPVRGSRGPRARAPPRRDERPATDRRPPGGAEGGGAAGIRLRWRVRVRSGAEPPLPRADARVLAGGRGRLGSPRRAARLV